MTSPLLIARRGDLSCLLRPGKANRHGLITGATGTGKTVTLQTLAEGFSRIGVPVFMADVKGDLSGLSQAGRIGDKLAASIQERGLDLPVPAACPVTFWDLYGEQGHPVRATISDLGPLLLARMLDLNETQEGVLQLIFKIADDQGLLLLDLKDLRAMCQFVGENAAQFKTQYGNVSAASIGAIQRGLLQIEAQGGDLFFGEPMLDIADFMQTVPANTIAPAAAAAPMNAGSASNGSALAQNLGVINILAADKLMTAPRLYAAFLLWLLSELFEQLPEAGDLDKPKLVFFFDEAHLLFSGAPKVLLERIELVVRLVRSKGVGVYFVTQNPLDIPDSVLGQLGNRVQHALRAYTPRDQKAVKTAADTMRPNPALGDMARAITELGVGEALISFLDAQGRPGVTERAWVLLPGSQIGPITPAQRQALMAASLVAGVYDTAQDRESAFEKLTQRTQEKQAQQTEAQPKKNDREGGGLLGSLGDLLGGGAKRKRASAGEQLVKSAASTIGRELGRRIARGVLGGILGSKR
jgi:DNA helicase HerA-like ATPase